MIAVIGVWLFASWVFVTAATGYAADRKGYSGYGWAVAGALFGPLALLAVVALPAKGR